MGVNKVTYGDNTLIDLTEDTVTEDTLLEGATAHNAKGERITGKAVAGDMFTSVYDTDNNGQVDKADDAEKLGGKTPDHYASKEDIPSIEGLATKDFVENAIKEIPEVDLSNYATKGEIPTKVSELENDEGYLTEHQSLEGYAKKEEIPTVPTKVSAFENDKGYLTEHQSLEAYAKKAEIPAIPTKVSSFENDKGYLTDETDPTVPSWAKEPNRPVYTAEDVGADKQGTASNLNSAHNTDTEAHNDIRLLIQGLIARLDAVANSSDKELDQLSEIVAYIKNNKSLIDGVTTSKVNITDIVANLVTNVDDKPLSASQGVVLKALIDAITVPTKVSDLENDKGYLTQHQSLAEYAKKAEIPTSLPANGGNSATVCGYGIRVTDDVNDTGADGFITFII